MFREGLRKDRTMEWEDCLVLSLLEADPMVSDIVQVACSLPTRG
jgi:hypothetical protein